MRALTATLLLALAACTAARAQDSASGGGSPPDAAGDPCTKDECGPAPAYPSQLCPDGVNWSGRGPCVRGESGRCGWSRLECPEGSALPEAELEQVEEDLASDDDEAKIRGSKWFFARASAAPDKDALADRFVPALEQNLQADSPLARRWAARALQTLDRGLAAIEAAASRETDDLAAKELQMIVARMKGKRAREAEAAE